MKILDPPLISVYCFLCENKLYQKDNCILHESYILR